MVVLGTKESAPIILPRPELDGQNNELVHSSLAKKDCPHWQTCNSPKSCDFGYSQIQT